MARKSVKRSKEDTVREYREAMSELALKLRVTQPVVDRALYIFDEFSSSRGAPFRGKNKEKMGALLVSCLYNAGKQYNQQKPISKWAQVTGLTLRDIYQAQKAIQPFIPAGSENDGSGVCENPDSLSQCIRSHVSSLCLELGFGSRENIIAEQMATEVVKSTSLRRKPASIAAVLIWICCLLHGREADLEVLSKNSVSVKVLRETYIELYPHLRSLVPTSRFGDLKDWVTRLRSP